MGGIEGGSLAMRPQQLFIALDTPELASIRALSTRLAPSGVGFKVGLEAFTALGPDLVRELTATGARVFLDLKFHDIPNTVAGAVRAAAGLGVFAVNLHASVGAEALAQARAELTKHPQPPLLWGVTVLSSLAAADLPGVNLSELMLERARACRQAGLDGVVASGTEIRRLRAEMGSAFHLVVPGIRPAGADLGDQKRILTPALARDLGADFLVIGRPVTGAPDPMAALQAILAEVAE